MIFRSKKHIKWNQVIQRILGMGYSLLLIQTSLVLFSQETFFLNNSYFQQKVLPNLYLLNNGFHTSVKPYNYVEVSSLVNSDTFISPSKLSEVLHIPFYSGVGENLKMSASPIVNINGGGNEKDFIYRLEGGIDLRLAYKEKLSFKTVFFVGNQSFPNYIADFVDANYTVPGIGIYNTEMFPFYTYTDLRLAYMPSKHFFLEAGYSKNFFGNGYRSLLLSDNATCYPFFKATTNVWKLKYVNLFTSFNELFPGNNNIIKEKKYGAFHYLSWNIGKRVNLSFFEGIIMQRVDSGQIRGLDINYLNPVLFYRPIEFAIGDPDNVVMGLDVMVKITNNISLYGQLMVDDFLKDYVVQRTGWWANKQAFQAGVRWFNLFKVKGLNVIGEYNYIRPYTYSHKYQVQNYSHNHQPLAHPLGANLMEGIFLLDYSIKNLNFKYQLTAIYKGEDVDTLNYGGNIFNSYLDFVNEFGNYVGQGLPTKTVYNKLEIQYRLIPENNTFVSVAFTDRRKSNSLGSNTLTWITIGLFMNPITQYFDF